jgi:hypothetical protein
MFQGGNKMTLYATTAVPSLDLLGGVETLQRILQSHTEVASAAYDDDTQTTVAVLKTNGGELCLNSVRDTLSRFQLPLDEARSFAYAVHKAQEMAHGHNVVEIGDYRLEDSFSL